MSRNLAIIRGHLGRDPELKTLNNGNSVATLSIATSDRYKNKEGEMVDITEWHRIKAFGKTADNMARFLGKGCQVEVIGKIRTSKWTDANGIDKYSTEIHVDYFDAIDKKEGSSSNEPAASSQDYAKASQGGGLESLDDKIPF